MGQKSKQLTYVVECHGPGQVTIDQSNDLLPMGLNEYDLSTDFRMVIDVQDKPSVVIWCKKKRLASHQLNAGKKYSICPKGIKLLGESSPPAALQQATAAGLLR